MFVNSAVKLHTRAITSKCVCLHNCSVLSMSRALLLQMFVKSAVTLIPGQPDRYEHIGALLTNTTRLEAGRKLLLQPGRGFLQALAAQLGPSSSVGRRRGCSGALRNCCISSEVGVGHFCCNLSLLLRCIHLFRMFVSTLPTPRSWSEATVCSSPG